MNYDPFLSRCKEKYPQEECWEAIITRFQDVFADGDFKNRSKVCEAFYVTDKLGKAQFFRMKKYVKELYNWLFEQGFVDNEDVEYVRGLTIDDVVSNREITTCYFRDLNNALDFVGAVGYAYGFDRDDDLLMIKTIVILSWYGLERGDIAEVRKSDLIDSETALLCKGRQIGLPAEHFNVLRRFADSDVYRVFPLDKRHEYVYSPYLMRTSRSVQMDKDKVSQAIKRFNAVALERFEHKLVMKALQNNGAFCKMLENAEQDSRALTMAVENIVGCDRHAAFWYKVMYEKWKCVYYPEGGDKDDCVG